MNNKEVADTFANRHIWKSEGKIAGSHLFIEGNVIYSHGYHFPLAIRLEDNTFILNDDDYGTNSTARHKRLVRQAIGTNKTFLLPTNELKEIIFKEFKTLKEIMLNKFYKGLKGGMTI